ncbi:MAG: hypothetical protein OEV28_14355 [Nitrospirota bacterium]|nr:hypothetical protein [Nitrospirota bacterium]
MSNCGLLVVKRGNWWDRCQGKGSYKSQDGSPSDEILQKYRGIEGFPWPEEDGKDKLGLENGLAPLGKFTVVRDYFQKVAAKYPVDFVCICFPVRQKQMTIELPENFLFLGYDYGNYISEYNLFSALLNEVVWGQNEEMRSYTRCLNEYLLFPKIEIVNELDRVRKKMLEHGVDLETEEEGEELEPIMIYQPV